MREPGPDYSAQQYERPNQPWVCGLGEHGHACPAGPTARGRCPALAECAPTRDGDRWQCNRSALRGGPCDDGPSPDGGCGCVHKCRPVRSLRAKRGRVVAACSLLALSGLLISLSSAWRDRVIRPGPLAQQHAQLLQRADGSPANCGACHSAASQNVAGWAASLVTAQDDLPTQTQLCMNCHSKTIPVSNALAGHNLPPDVLTQISRRAKLWEGEAPAEPRFTPPTAQQELRPPKNGRELACAACHREHHGAPADLTAIDNAACQTCHQQRYASFATDHPGFGNWPYERRTRIIFNHATHGEKHFAEKKQAFDCQKCHVADETGRVERLASYDVSCAGCHDEKIATSIARGVPMLALPTLDIAAFKKAGRDVGAWPAAATGDFDGRVPPMMKLLLAGDPKAAQAMIQLGPNFEFQDIDPDDTEQVAASADIAIGIQSLLAELSLRGPAAVRQRLSAALGRELSESELSALTANLSDDTLAAARNWLAGPAVPAAPTVTTNIAPLAKIDRPYGPAGDWSRDDATFSIRYRPAVHADPVLGSWLELLARTPQLDSRPIAVAMFKELTKTTAPGLCASCHSVEQSADSTLAINWRAYDRTTEPRGFTKFTHGPHLVLPQLANCTSCHAVDSAANVTASYADMNPRHFVSDFKPMTKSQCAECHTKTAAGDRCQSCHNYHVETPEPWRLTDPDASESRLNSAFRTRHSGFH